MGGLDFYEITATALFILYALSYLLSSAGKMLIFSKAGIADWKGFIPMYSDYLLYKIAWNGQMYWALFFTN